MFEIQHCGAKKLIPLPCISPGQEGFKKALTSTSRKNNKPFI